MGGKTLDGEGVASLPYNSIEKVYISPRAYLNLIVYGLRFASHWIPEELHKEVYGVLIGEVDYEKGIVLVKNAIGLMSGKKTGVELEYREYIDLSNLDEYIWSLSYSRKKNDFIIGWWHTHPGFGFFYSSTDIRNHLGFQSTNPLAIGIVFDYTHLHPEYDSPGIEVFMLDDIEKMEFAEAIPVPFEILGKKHVFSLVSKFPDIIFDEIDFALEKLEYISSVLFEERFCSLQDNYGLILFERENKSLRKKLVPHFKSLRNVLLSKKQDYDSAENDDLLLDFVFEENLSSKRAIPKFRKKVEKILIKLKKSELPQSHNSVRTIIEKMKEAGALYSNIIREFRPLVEDLRTVRDWLGSRERLFLIEFNHKLKRYFSVLYSLAKTLEEYGDENLVLSSRLPLPIENLQSFLYDVEVKDSLSLSQYSLSDILSSLEEAPLLKEKSETKKGESKLVISSLPSPVKVSIETPSESVEPLNEPTSLPSIRLIPPTSINVNSSPIHETDLSQELFSSQMNLDHISILDEDVITEEDVFEEEGEELEDDFDEISELKGMSQESFSEPLKEFNEFNKEKENETKGSLSPKASNHKDASFTITVDDIFEEE